MARSSAAARLAEYERSYQRLAERVADVGFITAGTVVRRSTRCGTSGCRCHDDPPQLHGPYYQWTAKVGGKTVTRRLNATEAKLYQGWITNDRSLRALIDQMRKIAAKATRVIIEDAARGTPRV